MRRRNMAARKRTDDSPVYTDPETARLLGELAQAKIRNYLHCVLVILTFLAYRFDDTIGINWVIYTSIASFISAFILYAWAFGIQRGVLSYSTRFFQRCASIVSDNLFISLVLHIGGASTTGIWALYIWISIGYGVRYGVRYLQANLAVSVIAFCLVAWFTPFWHDRPSLFTGLTLGMILVPLYTGWLIAQLHLAVSQREHAYKAKSEFVARMSHELRTPLHTIISTTDILDGAASSEKQKDLVNIISVSSSTLLKLINNVLDISKFDSGDVSLTSEPMNLHEIISETAHIVWPQAKGKGLDFRIFADPDIDQNVLGAPQQLKEVLVNLLGNASKFTERGHISLYATLQYENESTVSVSFQVSDSGPGIPKKDLERIFEPFVQADSSITRSHGGTGLGTSFSKELVRLMGGKIEVDSREGVGTVFIVHLSFRKQRLDENLKRFYPLNLIAISYVGEEKLLKTCLSKFGARVSVTSSIKKLLDKITDYESDRRIDGIFVNTDDFGENLGRIARKTSDTFDTRIIPIVGYGDPSLKTAAMTAGYCSYIPNIENEIELSRALDTISSLGSGVASSVSDTSEVFTKLRLRILVAEDDPTNRKIAKMILEEAGHVCTFVSNGDDALFELNDKRFDLAILDMHMPKRDGIEVAKIYNFSRFDVSDQIPIILFTADNSMEARSEAESARIAKFVTKPIRPSELLDTITETYLESAMRDTNTQPEIDTNESKNVKLIEPSRFRHSYIDDSSMSELLSYMTKREQDEFFQDLTEDITRYVQALEFAQTLDEIENAQQEMHSLAGAAVTVGAQRLGQLAKTIENLDKLEISNSKLQLLSELRQCSEETLREIRSKFG